jgi:hypothetical protein
MGGPQSRSGHGGEEKNSQHLPGLEPTIIQPVNQRYTTELSQLLFLPVTAIVYSLQMQSIINVSTIPHDIQNPKNRRTNNVHYHQKKATPFLSHFITFRNKLCSKIFKNYPLIYVPVTNNCLIAISLPQQDATI